MPPPEIPVVKVDELVESNHLLVQTEDDSDKIYDKVEELPAFPGGEIALMRFLSDNMKYPKVARESGIQGRVVSLPVLLLAMIIRLWIKSIRLH